MLGPLEVVDEAACFHSVATSSAAYSRCCCSSGIESCRATASSTRSGATIRPRPRRIACRSTSRSSAACSATVGAARARSSQQPRLHPPSRARRSRCRRVRAATGRREVGASLGVVRRSRDEPARSAVALWRGPALADLASEPFAQPEIARLEGLRLDALEARFEADAGSRARGRGGRRAPSTRRAPSARRAASRAAHGRALSLGPARRRPGDVSRRSGRSSTRSSASSPTPSCASSSRRSCARTSRSARSCGSRRPRPMSAAPIAGNANRRRRSAETYGGRAPAGHGALRRHRRLDGARRAAASPTRPRCSWASA